MPRTRIAQTAENCAGAFILLLTLLMSIKYGTISCMPEAGSFYPDGIVDYLYVSWPASTFGVFSGTALLLALACCRFEVKKSAFTLCSLLFFIAIPCAALWGKVLAKSPFYGEAEFIHFAAIGAYLAAVYILISSSNVWKNRIIYALGTGTLLLTISAFRQYFFGFKEMQEFAKMQESQGIVLTEAIRLKLIDGRVYGAMSSANLLAGFMLCAAPLLLALGIKASKRFEPQKQSLILFAAVSTLLGFGTLFMTKTRGAFLALGATAVIWLFSSRKIKRVYKYTALAAIAAVLIAGAFYIRFYGRGFGSMAERVSYLRTSAVMFAEKPLAGHGWGEFFYRHMQLKNTPSNESAHDPHNIVASFAIHAGAFAGLAVLAAFLVPLWNLWKRRESLDLVSSMSLWGCAAAFLHALQDINHQSPAIITALMLLLMVNQDNDEQKATASKPCKYALILFCAALGIASAVLNWQYTKGDAALSFLEECCRPQTKEKFHLSTPYNVEKALAAVNRLRPLHPFASNLAGAFYFYREDLNTAEKHYLKALSLDPRRPGVFVKLADIAQLRGEHEKAKKLYDHARKLFPSNPEYKE